MLPYKKEEIAVILKNLCHTMLNLQNTSLQESCPIGIIDFNKWEWPQGIGLYGMWKYYCQSGNQEYLDHLLVWLIGCASCSFPKLKIGSRA